MLPPSNRTPPTLPNIVDNVDDDNQMWIVPEEDGFYPHKVVIGGIANCIRSKFELARPSWKKFPESIREIWFEEFKKEAAGKDPSVSKFYFRTHRKKSDGSWVNKKAEATYNEFEIKKQEILAAQSASAVDKETNLASQLSQLSEMDIWVQSVGGKKKGRFKGLGSLG
ncbi:hypothetical protein P3L10_010053 [Capsicum annuum]|uniref:uncharacterized protein LOC107863509 n=1 Tax=Capsicum annuum TaxID=4072 RepID=UPI001FB19652|nr:uncharacterized protein LOC107863509 [Capsicum annuum]